MSLTDLCIKHFLLSLCQIARHLGIIDKMQATSWMQNVQIAKKKLTAVSEHTCAKELVSAASGEANYES